MIEHRYGIAACAGLLAERQPGSVDRQGRSAENTQDRSRSIDRDEPSSVAWAAKVVAAAKELREAHAEMVFAEKNNPLSCDLSIDQRTGAPTPDGMRTLMEWRNRDTQVTLLREKFARATKNLYEAVIDEQSPTFCAQEQR